MSIKLTRRDFLGIAGSLGAAILFDQWPKIRSGSIPVKRWGANREVGHLLRGHALTEPRQKEKVGTLIVGGGVSALSAAWELKKKGLKDFLILELENEVGGNSLSGQNEITAFPWGAHYIPLPTENLSSMIELFEELKVIEGFNSSGLPRYNELYLVHEPHERLFINGLWQEGLIPEKGIPKEDQAEISRFLELMAKYRTAQGMDHKKAFSLPVEMSSQDSDFLKLDKISMDTFLKEHKFSSSFLNWYVNYCCRDDYGTPMDKTSAWAGVHYFAARGGKAANAEIGTVLTWPEGNGWIIQQLKQRLQTHIRTQSLVYQIESIDDKFKADFYDLKSKTTKAIIAENVIFAAPRFVAGRVIKSLRDSNPNYLKDFSYAPWVVANVSVDKKPQGKGAPLSWDNVFYGSQSLGYVVSTHQNIERYSSKTVLTYYWPLTHGDPSQVRLEAEKRTDREWANLVIRDLEQMHPGISENILSIDYWIWGHGMIRPTPGFIWGGSRKESLKPIGNLFFAHSDMSGLSIFEEAQYRGVSAAKEVLKNYGRQHLG